MKHYVHNKSARYPDFNSSFEVYTDDKMLEIKTLSPLYRMEPKETIRHVENWSLSKAPERTTSPQTKASTQCSILSDVSLLLTFLGQHAALTSA